MKEYALLFVGIPYVWGGNDTSSGGMDCSGFILELLRSQGLWTHSQGDTSAQGLYDYFISASYPRKNLGVLFFYGQSTDKITHVTLKLNEYQVIEAGGGDRTKKTGMIRIRPITWRKDKVAEVTV